MAWRCSAASNADLVANLARAGLLGDDPRLAAAFRAVDRADYAPRRPYDDAPQGLGHGATISAPHMHAVAVRYLGEYVKTNAGARVLDIGAGSGYLTHVLAELAGDGDGAAVVVGMEHVPELVAIAQTNMAKSESGRALLASGRVRFVTGDGRHGSAGDGPFDAIHVGAAAAELPKALVDQLRAPGRLFLPLADAATGAQHVWTVDKAVDGRVTQTRLFGVRYVPLTDRRG